MSDFYGTLTSRGRSVTRTGSKNYHLRAVLATWKVGLDAEGIVLGEEPGIAVSLDGGSNGARSRLDIIDLYEKDTPLDVARKLRETAARIEADPARFRGWPQDGAQ